MSFLINSLAKSQFEYLFNLSAAELSKHRAVRVVATEKPGFPCRVSLADAEIGEEVILVNYRHLSSDTPYRAAHAVFVRPAAEQAIVHPNKVPEMLRSRMLSLRAFDDKEMMLAADLVDGNALSTALEQMFNDSGVAHIHIHFAKPGCYAARAVRASPASSKLRRAALPAKSSIKMSRQLPGPLILPYCPLQSNDSAMKSMSFSLPTPKVRW